MKTLAHQISEILFNLDPMNTGCKENDLKDEYLAEACDIADQVMFPGISVNFVVETVFDSYFWEGCLKQEALNSIVTKIKEL